MKMNLKKYIDNLTSNGCYSFTLKEISENLNLSLNSTKVGLSRLKKVGEIGSPARGYYIIIPLEYRSLGCLPPDHFIPGLMEYLNLPYYVGLLSASMYYGAAHQQPQAFQVMIPKIKRNLSLGKVRISFHMNKNLALCPIKKINTPMSILTISSPEATALDLMAYPIASGGFSNILTVLSELVEKMDLNEFNNTLDIKKDLSTLQRLGYIFELLGHNHFADAISKYLKNHRMNKTVLNPYTPSKKGEFSKRWKLIINEQIESDL